MAPLPVLIANKPTWLFWRKKSRSQYLISHRKNQSQKYIVENTCLISYALVFMYADQLFYNYVYKHIAKYVCPEVYISASFYFKLKCQSVRTTYSNKTVACWCIALHHQEGTPCVLYGDFILKQCFLSINYVPCATCVLCSHNMLIQYRLAVVLSRVVSDIRI